MLCILLLLLLAFGHIYSLMSIIKTFFQLQPASTSLSSSSAPSAHISSSQLTSTLAVISQQIRNCSISSKNRINHKPKILNSLIKSIYSNKWGSKNISNRSKNHNKYVYLKRYQIMQLMNGNSPKRNKYYGRK